MPNTALSNHSQTKGRGENQLIKAADAVHKPVSPKARVRCQDHLILGKGSLQTELQACPAFVSLIINLWIHRQNGPTWFLNLVQNKVWPEVQI